MGPLVLVAAAALPHRAWWVAGPAVALCASVPFVVDQADLDARAVNASPALGVAAAAALTLAATRRASAGLQPALPGDAVRLVLAATALVLSVPWLTALAGFHAPADMLLGEESFVMARGTVEAAVHLGTHHGLYGALLLLPALATSRVVPSGRGVRVALLVCSAALWGYGSVNVVQDLLNAITAVWLALAGVALLSILYERAILRR